MATDAATDDGRMKNRAPNETVSTIDLRPGADGFSRKHVTLFGHGFQIGTKVCNPVENRRGRRAGVGGF